MEEERECSLLPVVREEEEEEGGEEGEGLPNKGQIALLVVVAVAVRRARRGRGVGRHCDGMKACVTTISTQMRTRGRTRGVREEGEPARHFPLDGSVDLLRGILLLLRLRVVGRRGVKASPLFVVLCCVV